VKLVIHLIRGLAITIYYTKRTIHWATGPFRAVGRFLFRSTAVKLYRLIFAGKRHASKVYLPAKNKTVYIMTNRYAIHFAIVAVALVTSLVNFQEHEVRAESFGQDTILFSLVGNRDDIGIEEVVADSESQDVTFNYLTKTATKATPHMDYDFVNEDYTTVTIGGSAVIKPMISTTSESIAPRNTIESYIVQDGDTISTIAQDFGITINSLLWANDLSVTSVIRPGDDLDIVPLSGVLHTVKSGDTLLAIASKYDAETEEIMDFNKMTDASSLRIGEDLMIPGGEMPAPQPVRQVSSVSSIFYSEPRPADNVSVTGSGSMIWPTDWHYITQYYSWRHHGLDIDGDYSSNNYAADAGIVTYAGWLGGYGLLVEVNHGNGIVTRYGHFSKLYVSTGQSVSKGQNLGKMGSTGRSTGTHLHFEVIVNGAKKNPLLYIR